jgi:hypothetical protein
VRALLAAGIVLDEELELSRLMYGGDWRVGPCNGCPAAFWPRRCEDCCC